MHLICTREPQGSSKDLRECMCVRGGLGRRIFFQIIYLLSLKLPLETQQGGNRPAVCRDAANKH